MTVPVLVIVTPFSLLVLVFNTKLVETGSVVVVLTTFVCNAMMVELMAGGVEVVFIVMRRREEIVEVGVGRTRVEVDSFRDVRVLRMVLAGRVLYCVDIRVVVVTA